MDKRNLYSCGLACVAKTTTLQRLATINSIENVECDFAQLSAQNHEFFRKHSDASIQILYTIQQMLNSMKKRNSIFDRSPISDLSYDLIHEEMKEPNKGLEKLEQLLRWDLFRSICNEFKTIYILVEEDDIQAIEDIVRKMIQRQNGIDILNNTYVYNQIKIFKRLAENIDNFEILVKPREIRIHTMPYYIWLENELTRFIRKNGYQSLN